MYIGHYKAVGSANEFVSEKRKELDFPTQVFYKKERYSLFATHMVGTAGQQKNLVNRAKQLNIKTNVKI